MTTIRNLERQARRLESKIQKQKSEGLKTKHDGRLDEQNDCHVFYDDAETAYGIVQGIHIKRNWAWVDQYIKMSPEQALSTRMTQTRGGDAEATGKGARGWVRSAS